MYVHFKMHSMNNAIEKGIGCCMHKTGIIMTIVTFKCKLLSYA